VSVSNVYLEEYQTCKASSLYLDCRKQNQANKTKQDRKLTLFRWPRFSGLSQS